AQLAEARQLLADAGGQVDRLLIACHYPVTVPRDFESEIAGKPMANAGEVRQWLQTIGPHLYCCGHIHAAWTFRPVDVPNQLCINPGAPLLRSHSGHQAPGFVEILLEGGDVTATHHAWTGESWQVRRLDHVAAFFPMRPGP